MVGKWEQDMGDTVEVFFPTRRETGISDKEFDKLRRKNVQKGNTVGIRRSDQRVYDESDEEDNDDEVLDEAGSLSRQVTISNLEKQLRSKEEDLAAVREQKEKDEAFVTKVLKEINEKDKLIAELQGNKGANTTAMEEERTKETEELRNMEANFLERISTKEREVEELKAAVNAKNKGLSEQEDDLEALGEELDDLRAEKEEASRQAKVFRDKLVKAQAHLQEEKDKAEEVSILSGPSPNDTTSKRKASEDEDQDRNLRQREQESEDTDSTHVPTFWATLDLKVMEHVSSRAKEKPRGPGNTYDGEGNVGMSLNLLARDVAPDDTGDFEENKHS